MIVYKESEKLRAEAYKAIGYFFGSVAGLCLISVIVYGREFRDYAGWRAMACLLGLLGAYYFIDIGVNILRRLDTATYASKRVSIREEVDDGTK